MEKPKRSPVQPKFPTRGLKASPKLDSPQKPVVALVGYNSEDEVRSVDSSDQSENYGQSQEEASDDEFQQSPDKASDEELEEMTEDLHKILKN